MDKQSAFPPVLVTEAAKHHYALEAGGADLPGDRTWPLQNERSRQVGEKIEA